jgi:hypothetical protein
MSRVLSNHPVLGQHGNDRFDAGFEQRFAWVVDSYCDHARSWVVRQFQRESGGSNERVGVPATGIFTVCRLKPGVDGVPVPLVWSVADYRAEGVDQSVNVRVPDPAATAESLFNPACSCISSD